MGIHRRDEVYREGGVVPNRQGITTQAALAERNRMVLEQLPYVRLIAQRIHARLPHHVQLEDLINSGILGLIEALGKFDPRRKVGLRSYASYRIRGAILDSLREQDWGPRTLRQRGRRLEEARQQLCGRLGRTPSSLELARELGVSEKGFHDLVSDLQGLMLKSLEAESAQPGIASVEEPAVGDEQNPFELCRQSEMKQLLGQAMARLAPRQQRLLHLYYFKGLKMKEVGMRFGVCESRVSQMHTVALASLRRRLKQQLRCRKLSGDGNPRPPLRPWVAGLESGCAVMQSAPLRAPRRASTASSRSPLPSERAVA